MDLSTAIYTVATIGLIATLAGYCRASFLTVAMLYFMGAMYNNLYTKIDNIQVEDSVSDALNSFKDDLESDILDSIEKGLNKIYYDTQDISDIKDKLDDIKDDTDEIKTNTDNIQDMLINKGF